MVVVDPASIIYQQLIMTLQGHSKFLAILHQGANKAILKKLNSPITPSHQHRWAQNRYFIISYRYILTAIATRWKYYFQKYE
jgi:hypothetical protein